MSYKITNWVWEHSRARGPAHHVLLAIAERADDEGVAWPSMGDISRRCRIGIGTVQRAIPKLIQIGELEVSEGGKGTRSNRYRVITQQSASESGSFQSGTQSVPERNTNKRTSRSGAEGQCSGAEGSRSGAEGQCSAPGIEPTKNRSENRSENLPLARASQPPAQEGGGGSEPAWLTELQDAMSLAGIDVPWNFLGDDKIRLHNDVKRLGIPRMVNQAANAAQSANKPPFSSRWFYDGWHAMRTPTLPAAAGAEGNVLPLRVSRQQQEADDMFDRQMARARARRAAREAQEAQEGTLR